jgi:hypothetical protein
VPLAFRRLTERETPIKGEIWYVATKGNKPVALISKARSTDRSMPPWIVHRILKGQPNERIGMFWNDDDVAKLGEAWKAGEMLPGGKDAAFALVRRTFGP